MSKMNLAHDLGYTLRDLDYHMYSGELAYWFAWSKITMDDMPKPGGE
jgi:hypothetical protein